MFVSWCANQAGIPEDIIPKSAGSTTNLMWFKNNGRYHSKNSSSWSYNGRSDQSDVDWSYTPPKGDIMLLETNSNYSDGPDHTTLVTDCNGTLYTVEGNVSGNQVATRSYSLDNSKIWGYCSPAYYEPINPPSNVWLEKSQNWYDLNDTVTLTAHADNADYYWISVHKDGQRYILENNTGYNLIPKCAMKKTMDLKGNNSEYQTNIHIWECHGRAAQIFSIEKISNVPVYLNGIQTGDTTLDGSIDISDVTAIQRFLAELESFTDEQLALADANGDGAVDISDATHLQMYLAEYGVTLG